MKVDVAELAGIVAEGPLYGIFMILDIAAIYILLRRRSYADLNLPMLLAAFTMMLLATAQFVVDAANIFIGFITLSDGTRLERIMFFQDLTQPIFAAKHAIYFTMMFVGDAIVIYRCYIVWNSRILVVLLPILCSLASAGCAYHTIWTIRHHPDFQSIFFRRIRDIGLAIFTLSFGANAIATSLLAYKIWITDRVLRKTLSWASYQSSSSLSPIVRIVVESGALNTAYLLVYTLVLQTGSNGIEVVACIVTPLVGIIFSMVIIRAAVASEATQNTGRGDKASGPMFIAARPDTYDNSYSLNETDTSMGGQGSRSRISAIRVSDNPYKTDYYKEGEQS